MNLTLGIIIDGFSGYKPIIHKVSNTKTKIHGFQYYSSESAETDTDYVYVISAEKAAQALGENCPKHLIITGNVSQGSQGRQGKSGLQSMPELPSLLEKTNTLIQITKGISAEEVIQTGNTLAASHEEWYNSLLMAVINHKPIDVFLKTAAQALTNPIVVYNNNLSPICSAGSVTTPVKGTNWEIVDMPGIVLDSFYTPKELRKISSHIAQKSEQILVVDPQNDPAHSSMGILIWIEGKLYGGIGTVNMNAPFTEGQKDIFSIVAQVLKLYFQNHNIYMRIAENKAHWLDSLLDGVDVSAEIISSYLGRFKWKLDDYFCIVTFTVSIDLKIPIMSILDIRQINEFFSDALVSVYEEHIVIVIRCPDKQQPRGKKKEQLEQFLKKDNLLRCGVSMVFNNFLRLRHYFTQSKYAAAQCKPSPNSSICYYEDYYTEHLLQTISNETDPRCFCHPGILSLWESGSKSQRDLVECLYHYLLNGRNTSAAADAIHIHRNTLIYRLGKIEEILNVDIKNPSAKQAFLLLFSCMIVQHLPGT
jgi:hypothetical protein